MGMLNAKKNVIVYEKPGICVFAPQVKNFQTLDLSCLCPGTFLLLVIVNVSY